MRFGRFEFVERTGELLKDGVSLKLTGQALQLFAILLERAGEMVTREELQQRLWPHDSFGDFDHKINAAVNRMRQVLGDSAESPQYIETLPRRGYRFIAVPEPEQQSSPQPHPAVPKPKPKPTFPFKTAALIALPLLVLLVVAGFWRLRRESPRARDPESFKVMPITSLPGGEYHPAFSPDGTRIA